MDPLTLQSVSSPCPQGPPNRLTGLRWGERIALEPRRLDLIERTLTVEDAVVEMSIRNSPTGARVLTKPYPKDNEARPERTRGHTGAVGRDTHQQRRDL
jgi:hypothetical protein